MFPRLQPPTTMAKALHGMEDYIGTRDTMVGTGYCVGSGNSTMPTNLKSYCKKDANRGSVLCGRPPRAPKALQLAAACNQLMALENLCCIDCLKLISTKIKTYHLSCKWQHFLWWHVGADGYKNKVHIKTISIILSLVTKLRKSSRYDGLSYKML